MQQNRIHDLYLNKKIKIRRAKLEDSMVIWKILNETPELQGSKSLEHNLYSKEFVRDLILDKKMNLAIVAEQDNHIGGLLLAEIWEKKGYSFLIDLAVVPDKRNKGIGKKLYNHFENYSKRRNLKTILAIVQVENQAMQFFCDRVGLKKGREFYYYQKNL